MPKQDVNIPRNKFVNNVLELEKIYFKELEKIILSQEFKTDLLRIEKEIREKYREYKNIWNLKNKIKVPAERIVSHYIYMHFFNKIRGIYPAAVSSDIGIKMDDIILCVDIKTIDTIGNSGDIRSTTVEKNQTSFSNKNYKYIATQSNLKSIDHYSSLPVLTYVIKLIYSDDGYSFKLSREKFPTVVLACIPNGELSDLFDSNIIDNFKTYSYFEAKEGLHFKEIPIPTNLSNKADIEKFIYDECVIKRKYNEIDIDGKKAYYDSKNKIMWWKTSKSNLKVVRAVKGGATARYNNEILKARYDSKDNPWEGYLELKISEKL